MALFLDFQSGSMFKFALVLVSIAATSIALSPAVRGDWNNFDDIVAFGDSYTFVQGTAGYTNFSFIGGAQNVSFSKQDLFNDQILFNQASLHLVGKLQVIVLTIYHRRARTVRIGSSI